MFEFWEMWLLCGEVFAAGCLMCLPFAIHLAFFAGRR
jgi:hypothetical protein